MEGFVVRLQHVDWLTLMILMLMFLLLALVSFLFVVVVVVAGTGVVLIGVVVKVPGCKHCQQGQQVLHNNDGHRKPTRTTRNRTRPSFCNYQLRSCSCLKIGMPPLPVTVTTRIFTISSSRPQPETDSFATIASWESGNSLPNCSRNQCGCDVMATESDHVDWNAGRTYGTESSGTCEADTGCKVWTRVGFFVNMVA